MFDLGRNMKLWTAAGSVMLTLYVLTLLNTGGRSVRFISIFLDMSLLLVDLPIAVAVVTIGLLSRNVTEGSLHLLLSIPIRGRALLGARFLATAFPLLFLAIPSWIVEKTRLMNLPVIGGFDAVSYLQGLGVINIPFKAGVIQHRGTLFAGSLLVFGTIFLIILWFSMVAFLYFLGQQIGRKAGRPFGWAILLVAAFVIFSGPVVLGFIGSEGYRLPWPPPVSCSGWYFGIQECSIATSTIALLIVAAVALFWLSVRLWDRRLEVQ